MWHCIVNSYAACTVSVTWYLTGSNHMLFPTYGRFKKRELASLAYRIEVVSLTPEPIKHPGRESNVSCGSGPKGAGRFSGSGSVLPTATGILAACICSASPASSFITLYAFCHTPWRSGDGRIGILTTTRLQRFSCQLVQNPANMCNSVCSETGKAESRHAESLRGRGLRVQSLECGRDKGKIRSSRRDIYLGIRFHII
jgi:hypothetical protein